MGAELCGGGGGEGAERQPLPGPEHPLLWAAVLSPGAALATRVKSRVLASHGNRLFSCCRALQNCFQQIHGASCSVLNYLSIQFAVALFPGPGETPRFPLFRLISSAPTSSVAVTGKTAQNASRLRWRGSHHSPAVTLSARERMFRKPRRRAATRQRHLRAQCPPPHGVSHTEHLCSRVVTFYSEREPRGPVGGARTGHVKGTHAQGWEAAQKGGSETGPTCLLAGGGGSAPEDPMGVGGGPRGGTCRGHSSLMLDKNSSTR